MNDINEMPPVCAYCPYWEVCKPPYICPDIGDKEPKRTEKRTESHACDLIDRQPSYSCSHENDTISRRMAIDAIFGRSHEIIKMRIGNLPSVQPERKRGKWIIKDNPGTGWYRVTCSECGEDVTSTAPCIGFYPNAKVTWDYCPNCGADMREVSE